jgi:AmmeMemoRadiSam system protein A
MVPDLSEAAAAALLGFACDVVCAAVRGAPPPVAPPEPELQEPRGVFVSLHSRGHLRGCLGHVEPDLPLAAATAQMAEAVTAEDPRFAPVRPDELKGMEVEVSVLSPLRRIAPDEVRAGLDGLLIRRGRHAGLLLPQVATEHGMDRLAFLEALCQKAMLPAGAWRDPATDLSAFTVQRMSARVRA